MNILITGGAGYIGSVVSEFLKEAGHTLFLVDDLRDGNKNAIPKNVHFYPFDFGDISKMESIFSENAIDVVFHLAASASVPDSVVNPIDYYQNNTASTISLIKLMHKNNVRKIIFSSTAAVYGEPLYNPIDEQHVRKPVNPYGFSKLMCEQIIEDCSKAYGINYIIFRYFCAAGATNYNGEARMNETHIIPVIIDQVLGKRERIGVFGNDFDTKDGSGVRDFVHVADIARAHILAMEKIDHVSNEIINLGNGLGYSVLELLSKSENVLKSNIKYSIEDKRKGDPATLIATNQKAFQLLNWQPQYTIEDIILSAYKWRINPLY